MKSKAIPFLVGIICVTCLSAACASRTNPTDQHGVVVRLGENFIPNYMKGDNLSSQLDRDPTFLLLKEKDRYADIAYAFLDHQARRLKIGTARQTFAVKDIQVDSLDFKHIKFQQIHEGIRVWAKEAIIHLNQHNEVYCYQSNYMPLTPAMDTSPVVSEEQAESIVLSSKPADSRWSVLEIEQYVWAPDATNQRLTYRLTLLKDDMQREYVFVDTLTGKIVHSLAGTPSLQPSIQIEPSSSYHRLQK